MDTKIYDSNSASIKDIGDIDIKASKWDFLFDILLQNTHKFYFSGHRLEPWIKDIESNLRYVSNE